MRITEKQAKEFCDKYDEAHTILDAYAALTFANGDDTIALSFFNTHDNHLDTNSALLYTAMRVNMIEDSVQKMVEYLNNPSRR